MINRQRFSKKIIWPSYILLALFAIATIAWSCLAILIDGPQNYWSKAATAVFLIAQAISLFVVRPRKLGLGLSLILFLGVCSWWLQIQPRNDRNWMPDVAKLPNVSFNGDLVTIRNLRNFDYQSETQYTERWEERTYDLSKVKGYDVYLSYWGPKWMAHAISSWEFEDGKHLAISIETRKEVGEEYSALLGFFRQFELYYVVADERDLIKLRTNYRKEQVYLYHIVEKPEVAKALLVDFLKEVDELNIEPRWYNALMTNCSTAIREQASHVMKVKTWNWRMLVNGYLDELAYTRGQIDNSLPFAELKRRSLINERALASTGDFSADIRKQP